MLEDSLEVIASYLRPEEAGMVCGLLESSGIAAVVRDEALSALNPLLQSAIGGVKVVVQARDATRAREILAASGLVPGTVPARVLYELPEEEWSRPWTDRSSRGHRAEPIPAVDGRSALADRALLSAVVGTALLFPLLHLYSLWTIGRFFALPGRAAPATRTRAIAAGVLDFAALIAASSLAVHLLRR